MSNDVCRLGHLASAASMFDNMSQFYFTSHKEVISLDYAVHAYFVCAVICCILLKVNSLISRHTK